MNEVGVGYDLVGETNDESEPETSDTEAGPAVFEVGSDAGPLVLIKINVIINSWARTKPESKQVGKGQGESVVGNNVDSNGSVLATKTLDCAAHRALEEVKAYHHYYVANCVGREPRNLLILRENEHHFVAQAKEHCCLSYKNEQRGDH